jgi:hypothetical protein
VNTGRAKSSGEFSGLGMPKAYRDSRRYRSNSAIRNPNFAFLLMVGTGFFGRFDYLVFKLAWQFLIMAELLGMETAAAG